jgi:hypothetical protein
MSGRSVLVSLCACTAVLSGCSASLHIGDAPKYAPECASIASEHSGRLSAPIVLTAQSVPTASRLPCLRSLPAGWTFDDMQARAGRTRIVLDYGNDNNDALTVTLTQSCDVRGATRLVHDVTRDVHPFERTEQRDSQGYSGTRYVVFAGGCVTEQFDIHGGSAGAAAATISRSIGLVERAAVQQHVRDYSGDRIELDPSPGR